MIANTLIMPTERPPTARDVKRALLSFDKVFLTSPDDRELIPPNAYHMVSTGMPPIFGMSVGAVRPLGKIDSFDSEFDQMAQEATAAIEQDSLEIRSAPAYNQGFTLGGVPMPEGIPNPRLTYLAYRSLVANPEMIAAVSRGLESLSPISLEKLDEIAPKGAEDGNVQLYINAQEVQAPFPLKAAYPGFVTTEDERVVMTRLCHARLAALAKNLLICEMDGLIPFTSDIGIASVVQALDANTNEAIDAFVEDASEREVIKRLEWLQRVVVAEFIDPEIFDELTIKDVLKLRTKAWGKAGKARVALSKQLKTMALENPTFEQFREECRQALKNYQKERADLDHELAQLRIKAMSDVGMSMTKAGGGAIAAGAMIHKFLSTGSPEAALVLGGLYVFFKFTKDNATKYLDYLKKKEEVHDSSGYALLRPYAPFVR